MAGAIQKHRPEMDHGNNVRALPKQIPAVLAVLGLSFDLAVVNR